MKVSDVWEECVHEVRVMGKDGRSDEKGQGAAAEGTVTAGAWQG